MSFVEPALDGMNVSLFYTSACCTLKYAVWILVCILLTMILQVSETAIRVETYQALVYLKQTTQTMEIMIYVKINPEVSIIQMREFIICVLYKRYAKTKQCIQVKNNAITQIMEFIICVVD